jgi:GNAT superfamily N-acetyltransferase
MLPMVCLRAFLVATCMPFVTAVANLAVAGVPPGEPLPLWRATLVRSFLAWWARFLLRWGWACVPTVVGREHLRAAERSGCRAVIVYNHVSFLDPLALAPPGDGRQPTHSLCLVLGPDALDPTAMAALTAAAGWPARPPDRLAAALAGSYLCAGVVLAPLGDGSGGGAAGGGPPILVGAARATSDAAFNATLWDVLVHPAMRGRGVGAALVERVTAALLAAGLGNVTLFSTRGALPFYSGLGYAADPEGIRGMFYVGEGK